MATTNLGFFTRRVQAGLDIGSHRLKWASVDRHGKSCQIRSEEIYPERDSLKDNLTGEALTQRIQILLKKMERSADQWSRHVLLGIEGENTLSGYIELPKLSDNERETAILATISRGVPFPLETLQVVHLPVPSLTKDLDGFFFSAWKRSCERSLRAICQAGGLTVQRTELTGIALTRELFRNQKLDPERFYGILDIGFKTSQLIFARAGYPYYIRDFPVGGGWITHLLRIISSDSWSEAEQRKRESSVTQLIEQGGLSSMFSEFSYEIGRTLGYFRHQFNIENVTRFYMSGGGSHLRELSEWLSEELQVPFVHDKWGDVCGNRTNIDPLVYKVPIGLALAQQ